MQTVNKPSILIFSTAYLPLVGGAELAIKEVTDRISEYDFFLITTRFSRAHKAQERIGNVTVYRVGLGYIAFFDKLISPIWGAILSWRIMRRNTITLFWPVMVTFTSGAPFLLKLFGFAKKTPILLTLQEGDSETHLQHAYFGFLGLAWRFAVRRAHAIHAISTYLKQFARRMGARVPIHVIPNGVAVDHFAAEYNAEELDMIRKKLNKTPETVLLITTSRLVLKNAVDDVIKALQSLPKHIYFAILGSGEKESSLQQLAKRSGVADRVFFLGHVDHADLPKYLQVADIYIRPSLSEGLGSSFLEAMAAGLPVIATPVGGIPDFLSNEKTGLFCEPHNPKSIADAVLRLTQDNELRSRIIANAETMVRKRYDWNTVAQKMNEFFHEISHTSNKTI